MAPLGPAIEIAPSTTCDAESTGLATARIPGYETSRSIATTEARTWLSSSRKFAAASSMSDALTLLTTP